MTNLEKRQITHKFKAKSNRNKRKNKWKVKNID